MPITNWLYTSATLYKDILYISTKHQIYALYKILIIKMVQMVYFSNKGFRRLQKWNFYTFWSSNTSVLTRDEGKVKAERKEVQISLDYRLVWMWTSESVLTTGFCSLVCGSSSWAVWGCNITDDYTHLDPDIRRYETTRLGLEGKNKHAHIHTLLSWNNKTGALIICEQVSC